MAPRHRTHSEMTLHSGHIPVLPGRFVLREQVLMKCESMWWATPSPAMPVSSVKQLRRRQKVMGPAHRHFSAQKERPTHSPLRKGSTPSTQARLNPPFVCQGSTHPQFKPSTVMNALLEHLACLRACSRLKSAGLACIGQLMMKVATAVYHAPKARGPRIGVCERRANAHDVRRVSYARLKG